MQEALLLAVLGYIPGFIVSLGVYHLASSATLLPIVMTTARAIEVLILTIIMCIASGIVAMGKSAVKAAVEARRLLFLLLADKTMSPFHLRKDYEQIAQALDLDLEQVRRAIQETP